MLLGANANACGHLKLRHPRVVYINAGVLDAVVLDLNLRAPNLLLLLRDLRRRSEVDLHRWKCPLLCLPGFQCLVRLADARGNTTLPEGSRHELRVQRMRRHQSRLRQLEGCSCGFKRVFGFGFDSRANRNGFHPRATAHLREHKGSTVRALVQTYRDITTDLGSGVLALRDPQCTGDFLRPLLEPETRTCSVTAEYHFPPTCILGGHFNPFS